MNNIEFYKILKYIKKNYKSLTLNILSFAMIFNLLSGCKMFEFKDKNSQEVLLSEMDEDEIIEFYKSHGVNVKLLSNGMCYVTDYKYKNKSVIYAYSNDEFKKYVDIQNPTFNDIKEAILNNDCISDEYKKSLISFVSGLSVNGGEIDLGILYYNIITFMGFERISLEEIEKKTESKYTTAFFRPRDHKIYLPNNYDGDIELLLRHEESHLLTEAYYTDGKNEIIRTNKLMIPLFENEKNNIYINPFGDSFLEGSINLTLMENNMLKKVQINSYEYLSDIVNLFFTYNMESVTNYNEKGPVYFFEQMYSLGLNSVYDIISDMDECLKLTKEGDFALSRTMREEAYSLFMDSVVRNKVLKGASRREIYEMIIPLIENGFILKQMNLGDNEFIDEYSDEQKRLSNCVIFKVDQILSEYDRGGFERLKYDTVLDMLMGKFVFATNNIDGEPDYRLIYNISDTYTTKYYSYETLERLDIQSVEGDYIDNLGNLFYDEFGFFDINRYRDYFEENILKLKMD